MWGYEWPLASTHFLKAFLSHWFLVYFTLSVYSSSVPSSIFLCGVKALLHHLSLVHSESYFFFSFCYALGCCHLSACAALVPFVLFVCFLHNILELYQSCNFLSPLTFFHFRWQLIFHFSPINFKETEVRPIGSLLIPQRIHDWVQLENIRFPF